MEISDEKLWEVYSHMVGTNYPDVRLSRPNNTAKNQWVTYEVGRLGYDWGLKSEGSPRVTTLRLMKGSRKIPVYQHTFPKEVTTVTFWHLLRALLVAEYQTDYPDLPDELCKKLKI